MHKITAFKFIIISIWSQIELDIFIMENAVNKFYKVSNKMHFFVSVYSKILHSTCLERIHISSSGVYVSLYVQLFIHIMLKYYLLTYLLTPWSRVLLEKLTGFAANQVIPPQDCFVYRESISPMSIS